MFYIANKTFKDLTSLLLLTVNTLLTVLLEYNDLVDYTTDSYKLTLFESIPEIKC